MASERGDSLAVALRYHPSPGAAAAAAIEPRSGFVLDVTFTLPPGISILFGPSGAGKSTTLAAIAGLVRPQAGRIALGEEVWFSAEAGIDRPAHRRSVGFVFQSLALFPHLTALDNVAYGVDPRAGRSERRYRALAMLERMRVSHVAGRRPATLSGGEASGWRWHAPSRAHRGSCSSTNPSPRCSASCAANSAPTCSRAWPRRRCRSCWSLTTRRRPGRSASACSSSKPPTARRGTDRYAPREREALTGPDRS